MHCTPRSKNYFSAASDEEDSITRARTISAGEANVCKHPIVHVPSVTTEGQAIDPQMEREFSLNVPKGFAHNSLPTGIFNIMRFSRQRCDLQHEIELY